MIVGGYELHLYCDSCERPYHRDIAGRRVSGHQFSGDTKQDTYRQARKLGWRINDSKRTAMCIQCVRERA
jgi:hypothetical protein